MFLSHFSRKLVALLLLSYRCIVTVNGQWLFLTVFDLKLWGKIDYDTTYVSLKASFERLYYVCITTYISYLCIFTV